MPELTISVDAKRTGAYFVSFSYLDFPEKGFSYFLTNITPLLVELFKYAQLSKICVMSPHVIWSLFTMHFQSCFVVQDPLVVNTSTTNYVYNHSFHYKSDPCGLRSWINYHYHYHRSWWTSSLDLFLKIIHKISKFNSRNLISKLNLQHHFYHSINIPDQTVLCISINKRVLWTLLAGRNHVFIILMSFSITSREKGEKYMKRGSTSIKVLLPNAVFHSKVYPKCL